MTLQTARYEGECFGSPANCVGDNISDDENLRFVPYFGDNPSKTYRYGPTKEIFVELFPGKGVIVTYEPTARIVAWDWANRKSAFNWASERAEHMRCVGYRR